MSAILPPPAPAKNTVTRTTGIAEDAVIATPGGGVMAAALTVGDTVTLWDGTTAQVRWLARSQTALPAVWDIEGPIVIPAGALGPERPNVDTLVPPHHRVLVQPNGKTALVPVKALIGRAGIEAACWAGTARFVCILLDRHGVLTANGAAIESFYPGRMGLSMLSVEDQTAINALYPDVAGNVLKVYGPPARPILNGFEIDSCLEALGDRPPQGTARDPFAA